jgi:hypothetical protein
MPVAVDKSEDVIVPIKEVVACTVQELPEFQHKVWTVIEVQEAYLSTCKELSYAQYILLNASVHPSQVDTIYLQLSAAMSREGVENLDTVIVRILTEIVGYTKTKICIDYGFIKMFIHQLLNPKKM